MIAIVFRIWLVCVLGSSVAFGSDNLKAFPPADPGMIRHVIDLPTKQDESNFKVELVIGKTVKIDAHNQYFFAGKLETESIAGWGYDRYIVRSLGSMAGTLMATAPGTPSVDRFIAMGGEPKLLRYNSRLPLVVYVPVGVEVRYRIWQAGTDLINAP